MRIVPLPDGTQQTRRVRLDPAQDPELAGYDALLAWLAPRIAPWPAP